MIQAKIRIIRITSIIRTSDRCSRVLIIMSTVHAAFDFIHHTLNLFYLLQFVSSTISWTLKLRFFHGNHTEQPSLNLLNLLQPALKIQPTTLSRR